MPVELQDEPKLRPSNSTLIGAFAGGGAATTLIWIAHQFFSVDIPPDVATWLGSVLGGVLGYPFEGGRRG